MLPCPVAAPEACGAGRMHRVLLRADAPLTVVVAPVISASASVCRAWVRAHRRAPLRLLLWGGIHCSCGNIHGRRCSCLLYRVACVSTMDDLHVDGPHIAPLWTLRTQPREELRRIHGSAQPDPAQPGSRLRRSGGLARRGALQAGGHDAQDRACIVRSPRATACTPRPA
jgi:hypothetical protein